MDFDKKARYNESHEWVRKDGDVLVCGISDYAQDSLGDVVFVELPETGKKFKKGEAFGVVESVKAASDVYIPVSGEISEVNEGLEDKPETVNESPFTDGWLIKIKPDDESEMNDLMDADAYEKFVEDE
jgi:glycine cleavage system H protein